MYLPSKKVPDALGPYDVSFISVRSEAAIWGSLELRCSHPLAWWKGGKPCILKLENSTSSAFQLVKSQSLRLASGFTVISERLLMGCALGAAFAHTVAQALKQIQFQWH